MHALGRDAYLLLYHHCEPPHKEFMAYCPTQSVDNVNPDHRTCLHIKAALFRHGSEMPLLCGSMLSAMRRWMAPSKT